MKKRLFAFLLVFSMIFATAIPTFAADEPSSWAKAEVEEAIALGLVKDFLQNDYQANITRADFCALIMTLADLELEDPPEGTMDDEPENPFADTHVYAVIRAYHLGIVTGKSEGVFDPAGAIQRQEAAAMLARAAKVLGMDTSAAVSYFADGNRMADYAIESVDFVYSTGVMKGTGNGMFSPTGFYTREQAYMTVFRLYNALNGVDEGHLPATGLEVRIIDSSAYGDPLIFLNGFVYYRGEGGNIYRAPVYSPDKAERIFTLRHENFYTDDEYSWFYPKTFNDLAILNDQSGMSSGDTYSTIVHPGGRVEQFDFEIDVYTSTDKYDVVHGRQGHFAGGVVRFEARPKDGGYKALGEEAYLYGRYYWDEGASRGGSSQHFEVIDDEVYIIAQLNTEDEPRNAPGLYRVNIGTGRTERVMDEAAIVFRIAEEYIYFLGTDNLLYRIGFGGGTPEKLSEIKISDFFFFENEIHYKIYDDTSNLYRLRGNILLPFQSYDVISKTDGYIAATHFIMETETQQGFVLDTAGNIFISDSQYDVKYISVYNRAVWIFI